MRSVRLIDFHDLLTSLWCAPARFFWSQFLLELVLLSASLSQQVVTAHFCLLLYSGDSCLRMAKCSDFDFDSSLHMPAFFCDTARPIIQSFIRCEAIVVTMKCGTKGSLSLSTFSLLPLLAQCYWVHRQCSFIIVVTSA